MKKFSIILGILVTITALLNGGYDVFEKFYGEPKDNQRLNLILANLVPVISQEVNIEPTSNSSVSVNVKFKLYKTGDVILEYGTVRDLISLPIKTAFTGSLISSAFANEPSDEKKYKVITVRYTEQTIINENDQLEETVTYEDGTVEKKTINPKSNKILDIARTQKALLPEEKAEIMNSPFRKMDYVYPDNIAVFRPLDREWYFDYNHDGVTDDRMTPWGDVGDIPVAGDFDGDGISDDIAVFRPLDREWYFDYNHDGVTDDRMTPWGDVGDIPVAGDFDGDGIFDDIAVFRSLDREWYFDYNHDGVTDDRMTPWGDVGDIPVAGDFDGDGISDDLAVLRPQDREWYFDYNHDGVTDDRMTPWGDVGDIPVAGEFN
jgi:hypothetical protein